MTGEMAYINPKTGEDSNGDIWEIHLAVAQAVNGELKPFDSYQGPYIVVGGDLTVGSSPYAIPVQHLGIVRLWIGYDEDGMPSVYREDTDQSAQFLCEDDIDGAIDAAKFLLSQ